MRQQKVNYKSGDLLNNQSFPGSLEGMAGGIIIRLPLVGVREELATLLQLENIKCDEDLIEQLEAALNRFRSRRLALK